MDTQSTQTIASFTGTLLRKQKGSNNLVQLVFREKGEDVLCISSNPVAEKLPIGRKYHIEGVFKQPGKRAFIQEPRIQLLKRKKSKAKIIIGLAIATVLLLCIGVIIFALKVRSMPEPVSAQNAAAPATDTSHTLGASDNSNNEADAATPADTTEETTTTQPAAVTPKPTVKPATATTPAPTTPAVTEPTTPSEPVDETPVDPPADITPGPGIVPEDAASTEQPG